MKPYYDHQKAKYTTAIVAHKHGRKFVMIELSQTYIDEIGIPRIKKATEQLRLF